jgi:hypothetical protein
MPRAFLWWAAWLILEAISLNRPLAALSRDAFFSRPPSLAPAWTQADPDTSDWTYAETVSSSQELSLRVSRQSKQALTLVHAYYLLPPRQHGGDRLGSLPVSLSPPLFSFPRKLGPHPGEDEPFLN